MPQYHIPMGHEQGARAYSSLDSFTQGYIEAMFFTDASDPDDGDLADASFAELAPEAFARIIKDCEAFQTTHAALLAEACGHDGYDMERAGNDYWYTRNGHGVGFWDRGLGAVGDKLSDVSRYHEVDLYRGDDGLIYLQ